MVAAVALVPLLATPALGSASPDPSPTPTPTGVVGFTLAPVGNGLVHAGEPLVASVTLQNGTDAATPAGPVTLALGSAPLRDRSALDAWLGGDTSDVALQEVGATTLTDVAPGAEDTAAIIVAADPVLGGRGPGVYPLAASFDGPEGTLVSTSAMIVPDDAVAETGVGIVVPITAGPLAEGLLTSDQLAALTAPDGALSSALDAVEGTSAILAVDPAVLAAIRVLGTSAPASASAWLERLDALTNSRFTLQFGDSDIAPQLDSGQPRPLGPTSLQYAMSPADFIPPAPTPEPTPTATPTQTPTPTPTPTPTADPSAPVYPTLPELLDVAGERPAVFWPADGTASADVVSTLGAITSGETTSLTLVPSTSTTEGASGATVTARGMAGDAAVLVYDAAISQALQDASSLDEPALRGAPLTAATAHLTLAVADAGGAPLLVTLGRDADRSRIGLTAALSAVTHTAATHPLTLEAFETEPASAVDLVDVEQDAARTAAASAFSDDEARLARFATILDEPSLLLGPERSSTLQLLGVSWLADADRWATAVDEHRAATARTIDGVGLLPVPDVQQISPSADIPVWIHNDLPYAVNVVLYATPDDLRLDLQPSIPVTAPASTNTRVLIPVKAQIGSGDVGITLQLRSPTYEPIGRSQVANVTVRADWERYGLIALGVIVGGLLVVGVIRTIRRRGRARRADAATGDHDTATDAAAPAAAAGTAPAAEETRS
ncbi:hypothetical protein HLA99_10925 [Microbacterium ulmi]|uniref:2-oxoglutarate dehydrogenase n=1 Tax=Microbacterium ulmi TaxID=179095 RepID=A0A7Y2Q283_9MICO|nr:hypothetical protein [Microbacterium ulmi]